MECSTLTLSAAAKVVLDSPLVEATGTLKAPHVVVAESLTAAGKERVEHRHGEVEPGDGVCGGNL